MRFSFGLFSMLVTGLVSVGHVYIYLRLLRDTRAPRWLRRIGIAALVVLGPGFLVLRPIARAMPWPWGGVVSAAQWSWAIAALYLIAVLAAMDVAKLWRRRSAAATSPERRVFMARTTAVAAGAVTGSIVGYGFWRAYAAAPEIRDVALKVPQLPPALSGLTIAQLTDVHVGSLIQRRFVDELVARTNALKPDLVAITGDLVDATPAQIGDAVAALGNLRSRYGTFFVTGNHEYHRDEDAWCAALEAIGMTVLRNRSVPIGDAGHSFDLVGVDDWSSGRRRNRPAYDLDRALGGLRPDRARVLLAHQPANFVEAAERGVGLQISGHTHGGQVFPMTKLIRLHWPHVAGLYAMGDSRLFVSRGAGFWGPPLRLGSPPEVAKLVLLA